MNVIDREVLTGRFGGEWPSFHDAEVYGLRLDSGQRGDGRASLELDVHVFAVAGRPELTSHTLVTIRFEEVEDVELGGFGVQNMLFDLVLEDAGGQVEVGMPSSNGLGGAFRCRTVRVLRAEPFEPGAYSAYRR